MAIDKYYLLNQFLGAGVENTSSEPFAAHLPNFKFSDDTHVGAVHEMTKTLENADFYRELLGFIHGTKNNESRINRVLGNSNDARMQQSERSEQAKQKTADRIFIAMMNRLNELNKNIARLDAKIIVADEILTRLQNGEKFGVGPDGSLKDKDAEKLVQEYEKRTGQKIDRNDSNALYEAIHLEKEWIWKNREGYAAERENLETEVEHFQDANTDEERQQILEELDLKEAFDVIAKSDSIETQIQSYEMLSLSKQQSEERFVMENREMEDFDMDSMFESQSPISAATNHSGETSIKNDTDVAIEFAKASTDEQLSQPEEKITLTKSSITENLNFRSS